MRGMKKVYVYDDINRNHCSPFFKTRNDALKWKRENKENIKEMIFLFTYEVTRKSFLKMFNNNKE